MENDTIKNTGSKGRTIIIIILLLGLTFLLLEIFNVTSLTNITTNEVVLADSTNLTDDDSCAYFLNRSVEFLYDTLSGVEKYKKTKDLELSELINKNIELQEKLSTRTKPKNNSNHWKLRFVEVEKENLKLISDKYEYNDNSLKFYETYDSSKYDYLVKFSDSIVYNEQNKTNVSMTIPYGINYYKDGKLVNVEGLEAEVIFGENSFDVRQEISAETIITEKDGKLAVEIKSDNPDVKIHSKETFFEIDKRKIKQLIKKIDPNNYILGVDDK